MLKPAGRSITLLSVATPYSAYPPPGTSAATRSPSRNRVTPSPSAAISPATYRPGKSEAPAGGAYKPFRCHTSGPLIPAAWCRISTSPAPGRGTERREATSTSGPPGRTISMTVIRSGSAGLLVSKAYLLSRDRYANPYSNNSLAILHDRLQKSTRRPQHRPALHPQLRDGLC